jgi:hypothetical protein
MTWSTRNWNAYTMIESESWARRGGIHKEVAKSIKPFCCGCDGIYHCTDSGMGDVAGYCNQESSYLRPGQKTRFFARDQETPTRIMWCSVGLKKRGEREPVFWAVVERLIGEVENKRKHCSESQSLIQGISLQAQEVNGFQGLSVVEPEVNLWSTSNWHGHWFTLRRDEKVLTISADHRRRPWRTGGVSTKLICDLGFEYHLNIGMWE